MRMRPSDEFDEFVLIASPRLLTFAYRLTGDRQDSEDLLQSALLRVAKNWRSARGNPVAYARKVLVNLAKDGWRRRGRRPAEVPTGEADALGDLLHPQSAAGFEERDALLAALRELPLKMRTVLVLRYWEDLSVEETAQLMGCPAGTVKSLAARGLKRLRAVLETQGASK
jgi:RNA polymerase sigma-70 factor (sigma-E family)